MTSIEKTKATSPGPAPAAPAAAAARTAAPKAAAKSLVKTAAKVTTRHVAKSATTGAPQTVATAPVVTQSTAAIASTAPPMGEKLLKPKRPKLVRDSFTMPKLEYLILEELKHRSGQLGSPSKKSELIRAGIKALATMSDANLMAALKTVPGIKTGRPAKD